MRLHYRTFKVIYSHDWDEFHADFKTRRLLPCSGDSIKELMRDIEVVVTNLYRNDKQKALVSDELS